MGANKYSLHRPPSIVGRALVLYSGPIACAIFLNVAIGVSKTYDNTQICMVCLRIVYLVVRVGFCPLTAQGVL